MCPLDPTTSNPSLRQRRTPTPPENSAQAGSSAAHAAQGTQGTQGTSPPNSLSGMTPAELGEIAQSLGHEITGAIREIDADAVAGALKRLIHNMQSSSALSSDSINLENVNAAATTELAAEVAAPVMNRLAKAVASTVMSEMPNAFVLAVVQPSLTFSGEASLSGNFPKVSESPAKVEFGVGNKFVPVQMVCVYLPNDSPDQALIQFIKRNEVGASVTGSLPGLQIGISKGYFNATEDVLDFQLDLKELKKRSQQLANNPATDSSNANNGDQDNDDQKKPLTFDHRYAAQNHQGWYGARTYKKFEGNDGREASLATGVVDMEFRQRSFYTDTNNTKDRNEGIKRRAILENGIATALGGATYGIAKGLGAPQQLAVGAAHFAAIQGLEAARPVLDIKTPPSANGIVSERDYIALDVGTIVHKLGDNAELRFSVLLRLAEKTGYNPIESVVVDFPFIGPIERNPSRDNQIKDLLTRHEATNEVANTQMTRLAGEIQEINQEFYSLEPDIEAQNLRSAELTEKLKDNSIQSLTVETELKQVNTQRQELLRIAATISDSSESSVDGSRLVALDIKATELIEKRRELEIEGNTLKDMADLHVARSNELNDLKNDFERLLDKKNKRLEELTRQITQTSSKINALNMEAASIQKRKDNNEARAAERYNSHPEQTRRREALRELFASQARAKQEARFREDEEESKKDV